MKYTIEQKRFEDFFSNFFLKIYGPMEKDRDNNVYFRDKDGSTKLLGYLSYEPSNKGYYFFRWFAAQHRFDKLRHWFGDQLEELFLSLLKSSFPEIKIEGMGSLGKIG